MPYDYSNTLTLYSFKLIADIIDYNFNATEHIKQKSIFAKRVA